MNNIQFDRCLQRIRNGNMNGLRPIFDGYYGALKITAKRILNSDTAADNAASETLLEIVRYAGVHNRPHIENVRAYLYDTVTKIAAHMLEIVRRASLKRLPRSNSIVPTEQTTNMRSRDWIRSILISQSCIICSIAILPKYQIP